MYVLFKECSEGWKNRSLIVYCRIICLKNRPKLYFIVSQYFIQQNNFPQRYWDRYIHELVISVVYCLTDF